MLLLAALTLSAASSLVPARWRSRDPKTLDLIRPTPVNCLLLEKEDWSEAFTRQAASANITLLGVVRPGAQAVEQGRRAMALGLRGVVLEGDFDPRVAAALTDSRIPTISLPSRSHIALRSQAPVLGTTQGVWPGVRIEADGAAKSAPSGAPWIDTNTGFLRFVRAVSSAPVWIATVPPGGLLLPVERYLEAIADAAMSGAQWVVSLDPDFFRRLTTGDAKALQAWTRIGGLLRFYDDHREWRTYAPHSELALVEDVNSGALLAGGILDMIAVKHTPVRPVPTSSLMPDSLRGSKLAADVDPASLSTSQQAVLQAYTRAGGTLLNAPPGWKFPMPKDGGITLDDEAIAKLDEIWQELNSLTGRRNLGARLFNVSTMLSNLVAGPGGKPVLLHLVNYSDFSVESITIHVLGQFHRARLFTPEEPPRDLPVYPVDQGTGIDIDKLGVAGALLLE